MSLRLSNFIQSVTHSLFVERRRADRRPVGTPTEIRTGYRTAVPSYLEPLTDAKWQEISLDIKSRALEIVKQTEQDRTNRILSGLVMAVALGVFGGLALGWTVNASIAITFGSVILFALLSNTTLLRLAGKINDYSAAANALDSSPFQDYLKEKNRVLDLNTLTRLHRNFIQPSKPKHIDEKGTIIYCYDDLEAIPSSRDNKWWEFPPYNALIR